MFKKIIYTFLGPSKIKNLQYNFIIKTGVRLMWVTEEKSFVSVDTI